MRAMALNNRQWLCALCPPPRDPWYSSSRPLHSASVGSMENPKAPLYLLASMSGGLAVQSPFGNTTSAGLFESRVAVLSCVVVVVGEWVPPYVEWDPVADGCSVASFYVSIYSYLLAI